MYLVATKDHPPFFTEWFDFDNNFNPDLEMVVYDIQNGRFCRDGTTWEEIQIDHL